MIFVPILIVAFRDGRIVTIFRQALFYIGPVVLWFYLARFLGVPSAAQMRAAAARALRRHGPADAAPTMAAGLPDPATAALPPAVRRRRAALAAAGSEQA